MLCKNCHETSTKENSVDSSTLYALQFIITSPIEKLFSFKVTEPVQEQMEKIIQRYICERIDKKFNSLDFIENMY